MEVDMNRIVKTVLLFLLLGTIAAACVQPAATPMPDPTDTPVEPSATPTSTVTPTPVPSLTPSPTPRTAEVTVSPSGGPPGMPVQVTGEDFPPNAHIEIGIGVPNAEYEVIETSVADEDGDVAAQIVIPEFAEPDDDVVIVVSTAENSAADHTVKAVSDPFDVTAPPRTTATPEEQAGFTRTDIYLIAVGDDGQSGQEIGCDDSVIPVEVEIEPTIAPLTAAMEKLLALKAKEYGQSGLYNALYRSDLTVESIDIENREAIIELSGTLRMGGVCDEPRVRAQLRQTALQYETVDRVSIYIDGTPLGEILGQDK
jgi:hypothetical protein